MSTYADDIPLERLRKLAYAKKILPRVQARERLEDSLSAFVKGCWASIDPAPYQPTWAIDALCEHLQAIRDGEIRRLLVNFPPRCAKTNVTSIAFPAWIWAQRELEYLSGPQVRFLCGSYNDDLSLQNSTAHRRLLLSPWYQARWSRRYSITGDQNTKSKFDTTEGGSRISVSARGSLLGIGGDIVIIDDPHNLQGAESDAERITTRSWWREISTTRLNDPKLAAIIVIMQRLHEEDISGVILSSEWSSEWTHLCIPMEYERSRHCATGIGWQDPRGVGEDGRKLPEPELEGHEGELMWPERFGAREVEHIKAELGPYFSSGRLQQMPVPDKGGIFERQWWQVWDPPDGKFPEFDYIIASLDGAFTEDEENDPSALTVWGIFKQPAEGATLVGGRVDERTGQVWQGSWTSSVTRVMLVHAWRKHLAFSGPKMEYLPGETPKAYKRRCEGRWGLLEWVSDTWRRFKVDKVLIEAKASGISAAQALRSWYGMSEQSIMLCPVKGDKVARALAVQPTFAGGLVYAPVKDWSDMVISEMAVFPKGRYDDLTDSATQAVRYLREAGLLRTDKEQRLTLEASLMHKSKPRPLYPV